MTKDELYHFCINESMSEIFSHTLVEKAALFAKQFSEDLIRWLNDNDFKFTSFHDNMQSDLVNNGIRMHKSEIIDLFIEQQTKDK